MSKCTLHHWGIIGAFDSYSDTADVTTFRGQIIDLMDLRDLRDLSQRPVLSAKHPHRRMQLFVPQAALNNTHISNVTAILWENTERKRGSLAAQASMLIKHSLCAAGVQSSEGQ